MRVKIFLLIIGITIFFILRNQLRIRKKHKVYKKIIPLIKETFDEKKEKVIILKLKDGNEIKFPNYDEKKIFLGQFYEFVYPFLLENKLINKDFLFYVGKTFRSGDSYFYRKVQIEKGDVVIDAGGCLGVFSCLASSLGAKVYVFEPVREIREKYLILVKKMYPETEIVPYGLSDRKEIADIFIAGESSSIIIRKKEYLLRRKEKIQTISLDEWVSENNISKIDFIKADIEGAERLMLKGAYNVLKNFAPKLSICTYHLPDDKKVLSQLILKANPDYKIKHGFYKLYAWVEKNES